MNNAGILQRGDIEFTSVDTYKKVAEVNLFGIIRMTKACLPLLRLSTGELCVCVCVCVCAHMYVGAVGEIRF